jgi:TetR/AcrR family transcriptional regulator, tetracycline repressor protein
MAARTGPPAVSRDRLLDTALELLVARGLDAVTMRGLADRLGVRPASLYWHLRDRGELMQLLAAAFLREAFAVAQAPPAQPGAPAVPQAPGTGGSWRARALTICAALERVALDRRDGTRILLEALQELQTSDLHADLAGTLVAAGLSPPQARDAATMMLVHVLTSARCSVPSPLAATGRTIGGGQAGGPRSAVVATSAFLAVDSGSRGVLLRAGSGLTDLIRVARDPAAAAPAVVQGATVTVRRRRGVGHGELELNRRYRWMVKIQGPTWNTTLDATGLSLEGLIVEGGATRVECILPPPRGVVPISVAGGAVGVRLRRPPGVAVVADVSAGAIRLRLDDLSIAASVSDVHWVSDDRDEPTGDHYLLRVSGGAAKVTLEVDPSIEPPAHDVTAPSETPVDTAATLNLLLDGVASRQQAADGTPR